MKVKRGGFRSQGLLCKTLLVVLSGIVVNVFSAAALSLEQAPAWVVPASISGGSDADQANTLADASGFYVGSSDGTTPAAPKKSSEISSWVLGVDTTASDGIDAQSAQLIAATEDDVPAWVVPTAESTSSATPPAQSAASGGGNGSRDNQGGRLGTANYANRNRSAAATARNRATSGFKFSAPKPEPGHRSSLLSDPRPVPSVETPSPASPTSETPSTAPSQPQAQPAAPARPPVSPDRTITRGNLRPTSTPGGQWRPSVVARRALPQRTTYLPSDGQFVVWRPEPFPVEPTHLMGWQDIDHDIKMYRFQRWFLHTKNTTVLVLKVLFWAGNGFILLYLLRRHLLMIWNRLLLRLLSPPPPQ